MAMFEDDAYEMFERLCDLDPYPNRRMLAWFCEQQMKNRNLRFINWDCVLAAAGEIGICVV